MKESTKRKKIKIFLPTLASHVFSMTIGKTSDFSNDVNFLEISFGNSKDQIEVGSGFNNCISNSDCNYNGVCDVHSKMCKCNPWYSGDFCDKFEPQALYRHSNVKQDEVHVPISRLPINIDFKNFVTYSNKEGPTVDADRQILQIPFQPQFPNVRTPSTQIPQNQFWKKYLWMKYIFG